jgi:pyruvate kinase
MLPNHKTKIVATVGPASESPEMLERLIRAGLNVARLNFSHGDFTGHAERIARIRAAERATGQRVAIMADLPGPKMRVGKIEPEPIQLLPGDAFTLTGEDIVGNAQRVSMSFPRLPQVVKPGDRLFLNDGLVQLVVQRVAGNDVHCKVAVGGELRSKKGLNLPGIDLGISAFTDHDRSTRNRRRKRIGRTTRGDTISQRCRAWSQPGSAAVDAGQALPNLCDDFVGAAPDLGAHELGRPEPH